jgi:hypothetical protein
MLCVVSQLALYFYFKQSFWMIRAEGLYLLTLNLLTAISFAFAIRYYSLLRYLFIAFIIMISISSMMQFTHHFQLIYLASSVVLPAGAAFYFYRKHQALETILLIAGLAASLSLWLFELVDDQLTNSAAGLFILAMLIFGWFAMISFALKKIFPQTKFSVIPLALGAWIAGNYSGSLIADLLESSFNCFRSHFYWHRLEIIKSKEFHISTSVCLLSLGLRASCGINSYGTAHR